MTREEAREAVREAYDYGDPEYANEVIKALEGVRIMNAKMIKEIYNAGYRDGEHDGYFSTSIEEQRTEQYYGKELPSCNDLWIPTKERRPEMFGRYLCCFEDGYITTIFYYRGEFLIEDWEPIAWMPLPEPYKEVEKDDE